MSFSFFNQHPLRRQTGQLERRLDGSRGTPIRNPTFQFGRFARGTIQQHRQISSRRKSGENFTFYELTLS